MVNRSVPFLSMLAGEGGSSGVEDKASCGGETRKNGLGNSAGLDTDGRAPKKKIRAIDQ